MVVSCGFETSGGIAEGIALAEAAERWVRRDGGCETVTPAQLGIVCFAGAGWGSVAGDATSRR